MLALTLGALLPSYAQDLKIKNNNGDILMEVREDGVLLTKLTTAERTTNAANLGIADIGLLVYDTDTESFWFWNSSEWESVGGNSTDELQTLSQSGTDVTLSDGGGTITVADADSDPTNEIELPTGGNDGQVLATDGAGNYSWADNGGGSTTYAVGDLAHGGIVFYVNAEGTHGLVAANVDQGISDWYDAHDNLSNPVNHDAEGGKYFDWRLPSRWELNEMYSFLHLYGIGGFVAEWYRSSTESGGNSAWVQDFGNGDQIELVSKAVSRPVRAVRAF